MSLSLIILILAILGLWTTLSLRVIFFYECEEKSSALGIKAILLAFFVVVGLMGFLLPIDVCNQKTNGGLNMDVFWKVGFTLNLVFLCFLLPFGYHLHEAEGSKKRTQLKNTLIRLTVLNGVLLLMAVGLFFAFRNIVISPDDLCGGENPPSCCRFAWGCSEVSLQIDFFTHLVALQTLCGWFFFAVFGGFGLIGLPLWVFEGYLKRPVKISEEVYKNKKEILQFNVQRLVDEGLILKAESVKFDEGSAKLGFLGKRKGQLTLHRKLQSWQNEVQELEETNEGLQKMHQSKGENPLVSWSRLLVFGLCVLLSVCWILNLVLFVLCNKKYTLINMTFLNSLLTTLGDTGVELLPLAVYGCLTTYITCVAVNGAMKLGSFALLFSLPPLKEGHTELSTFFTYAMLISLCVPAITQFSQDNFSAYSETSAVHNIFYSEVRHMPILNQFFRGQPVFCYILLGTMALTAIVSLCKPKKSTEQDQRQKLNRIT